MGLFGRAKPMLVTGLHKDSDTPMGTIWSVVCPSADEEGKLALGELIDRERVLETGDIINVRSRRSGAKRFALRVTGREDDLVHCVRLAR